MAKEKIYRVTAKNVEYLFSQKISAKNIEEAKENYLASFNNGEIPIGSSQILFQEIVQVS